MPARWVFRQIVACPGANSRGRLARASAAPPPTFLGRSVRFSSRAVRRLLALRSWELAFKMGGGCGPGRAKHRQECRCQGGPGERADLGRLWMNCNQVFNILTRGPFPSGDRTDAAVEIHLATCPDCRDFAEALRPALDVYQETVSPEECGNLPGYWGDLAPVASERAIKTAQRSHAGSRALRLQMPTAQPIAATRSTQWLFAAVVALFVGCMLLASAVNSLAVKLGGTPAFAPLWNPPGAAGTTGELPRSDGSVAAAEAQRTPAPPATISRQSDGIDAPAAPSPEPVNMHSQPSATGASAEVGGRLIPILTAETSDGGAAWEPVAKAVPPREQPPREQDSNPSR